MQWMMFHLIVYFAAEWSFDSTEVEATLRTRRYIVVSLYYYCLVLYICCLNYKRIFLYSLRIVQLSSINIWIYIFNLSQEKNKIDDYLGTRAAASSSARDNYVPIADMLKTAGWLSDKCF